MKATKKVQFTVIFNVFVHLLLEVQHYPLRHHGSLGIEAVLLKLCLKFSLYSKFHVISQLYSSCLFQRLAFIYALSLEH